MLVFQQPGEEHDDDDDAGGNKALSEEGQHMPYDESQHHQPEEQQQPHTDSMMLEGMKEEPGYTSLAMTLPDPNAGMLITLVLNF